MTPLIDSQHVFMIDNAPMAQEQETEMKRWREEMHMEESRRKEERDGRQMA